MNQQEFQKFIHPSFVTWESVKQTLMSSSNILVTGSNFSDDSIIFESTVIFNSNKGLNLNLNNNQFIILQSGSIVPTNPTFLITQAYDLTNNLCVLPGSIGSIYAKSVIPGTDQISYNFLLFRVN
jgi:hypothetical protein